MPTFIVTEEVNLRNYPTYFTPKTKATLTVGDMHGNTMKLLWILIHHGAISMSKEDFDAMWEIYDKIDKLPNVDDATNATNREKILKENNKIFEEFNKILKKIEVKSPEFRLRFIGDVFADRGKNDCFTLKVLGKLNAGGIKYEILYSNHDAELLRYYDEPTSEWEFRISKKQQTSLMGLLKYIRLNPKNNAKEVKELVQNFVVPKIKLISYSLSEDKRKIDLFMHAPNDFEIIQKLKGAFHIDRKLDKNTTAKEFAQIIDDINSKFASYLSDPNQHTYEIDNLLEAFIWNRLDRDKFNNYRNEDLLGNIDFTTYPECVHYITNGHTFVGKLANKRQNGLDTPAGRRDIFKEEGKQKIIENNNGTLICFVEENLPSKIPKKELVEYLRKEIKKRAQGIKPIQKKKEKEEKPHTPRTKVKKQIHEWEERSKKENPITYRKDPIIQK